MDDEKIEPVDINKNKENDCKCNRKDLKLAMRYLVLLFFMYLAYTIVSPVWIRDVKNTDPMTINVIVGAVFGALTLIIKEHFTTKVSDN